MPTYISIEEAANKIGGKELLLKALRIGNVHAEGRFADIDNQGEDYDGDDYATIPAICWQDYELKENGNLFHEQHMQGYHAIRLCAKQFDNNDALNKGGRPPSIDKERLFAEIAAYLYTVGDPPKPTNKLQWKQKIKTELPYFQELTELRKSPSEKTFDRSIDAFLKHYFPAFNILGGDGDIE